jgi:hypothetical protein
LWGEEELPRIVAEYYTKNRMPETGKLIEGKPAEIREYLLPCLV